jgi:hypothetical protein
VTLFLCGMFVGAFCAVITLGLVVAAGERRQVLSVIRQYTQKDVTRNRPNERASSWVIAGNGGVTGVRTRSGVDVQLWRDR